tara:strand:+ start:505 stop:669 length:165 start_codon:yes stop_codon:yes gene_type:complete
LEITDEQRRNILLTEEDILAAKKKYPLANIPWVVMIVLAVIAIIMFVVGAMSIF